MKRASKVALSFDQVRFTEQLPPSRKTMTGNPVRPAIAEIGTRAFQAPSADGPLHLLVFGGSQGARVFGRVVAGNQYRRRRIQIRPDAQITE